MFSCACRPFLRLVLLSVVLSTTLVFQQYSSCSSHLCFLVCVTKRFLPWRLFHCTNPACGRQWEHRDKNASKNIALIAQAAMEGRLAILNVFDIPPKSVIDRLALAVYCGKVRGN